MAKFKSIDTSYNGHRFRSRLEARWALYFDLIGIKYEYEPQGYYLESGICYLPDFYLPNVSAYAEIKPKSISIDDLSDAMEKIEEVAFNNGKFALICVGDPMDNSIKLCGRIANEYGNGWQWETAEFIYGAELLEDCGLTIREVFDVGIVVGDRGNRNITRVAKADDKEIHTVIPFSKLYGYQGIPYEEQERARQARFEHGEDL